VEEERKERAMWYGGYYGYPFYPTVYPAWGYGAYWPYGPRYWWPVGFFP
jgi:hypothetical protein